MRNNTNYYRLNKQTKKVIHICPHCSYSTTGPKITLKHHILSKHTEECDRPFQCQYENCDRGFAQKSNYDKHLSKVHNKKIPNGRNKTVLYYHVSMGDNEPSTKKTHKRLEFYKKNIILTYQKIDNTIGMGSFHYDMRFGYINVESITERDILNNVVRH